MYLHIHNQGPVSSVTKVKKNSKLWFITLKNKKRLTDNIKNKVIYRFNVHHKYNTFSVIYIIVRNKTSTISYSNFYIIKYISQHYLEFYFCFYFFILIIFLQYFTHKLPTIQFDSKYKFLIIFFIFFQFYFYVFFRFILIYIYIYMINFSKLALYTT